MSIRLSSEGLAGLVDNFAGMFVSYAVSRKSNTPVYFTNFEETTFDGAISVASGLPSDTLVIVVDTVKDSDAFGKAGVIGNNYLLNTVDLKKKFSDQIYFYDEPFEPDMDETWVYGHRFHLPAFYFGIPIPGEYHDVDNRVGIETLDRSALLLERVITTLRTS